MILGIMLGVPFQVCVINVWVYIWVSIRYSHLTLINVAILMYWFAYIFKCTCKDANWALPVPNEGTGRELLKVPDDDDDTDVF